MADRLCLSQTEYGECETIMPLKILLPHDMKNYGRVISRIRLHLLECIPIKSLEGMAWFRSLLNFFVCTETLDMNGET